MTLGLLAAVTQARRNRQLKKSQKNIHITAVNVLGLFWWAAFSLPQVKRERQAGCSDAERNRK